MRNASRMLIAFAILSAGAAAVSAPQESLENESVPQRLDALWSQRPLWVSASASETAAGTLDLELVGISVETLIGMHTQSPDYEPSDCIWSGIGDWLPPPGEERPFMRFSDLVAHSLGIYGGEVIATEQGFGSGGTGTLLKIEVADILKTSGEFDSLPILYVIYSGGDFEAGGYRFCARDDTLPPLPTVGDRVLLFPYFEPEDTERSLVTLLNDEILVEHRGELQVPVRLHEDAILRELGSIAEVKSVTQELLRLAAENDGHVSLLDSEVIQPLCVCCFPIGRSAFCRADS